MKTRQFRLPSFIRLAIAEGLIITFITLLSLPTAAFATGGENVAIRRVGAVAPLATTIVVNVSNDADALSAAIGCDTDAATPGDQCSLRSAIQYANALAGDDQILLNIPASQPNCDSGSGSCTIRLTQPLPALATNINIQSPAPGLVTVQRFSGGDYRIFTVTSATIVTLSGIRIEGGRPGGVNAGGALANAGDATVNIVDSILMNNIAGVSGGKGGAIYNENGIVNITNSLISDNRATVTGGAIHNAAGTLNITRSMLLRNTVNVPTVAHTNGGGGAIANVADGTVTITNSVVGDSAVTGGDGGTSHLAGAGIWNVANGSVNVNGSVLFNNRLLFGNGGAIANPTGTLNVTNSTIINNRAVGGGIHGLGTIKSSIIAKNNDGPFSGSDVLGSFTSEGFNLIGVENGATGFGANDLKGTIAAPLDPKFDPNAADITVPGFSVPVPGLPLCGSPVIDKGTTNGLATDPRGTGSARTVDDPNVANAADGTDIGAFERQAVCVSLGFTVNTSSDADDVNTGDGVCDSDSVSSGSQCTLRAALKEVSAVAGDYAINFAIPTSDPGFDPGTGKHTINLTGPLPEISSGNLSINGPGKDKLIVRRNTGGFYRILTFGGVVETVMLSGLTVNNGFNSGGNGGAVSFTGTALSVNSCAFNNNISAFAGGALFVLGKLTVADSTFNNNFSSITGGSGGGGAISVAGGLSVSSSTFTDNVASNLGGAINVVTLIPNGDSNVTGSFFEGNSAGGGGAVSIATSGVVMRVVNSKFNRNISTRVFNEAGGIYHDTGTLHVIGSTLTNHDGYAIASDVANGSTATNITDTTISGNTRGGVLTEESTVATGKLNVTNSTISGNVDGPGIRVFRVTLNVSNSTIANNEEGGIRQGITGSNGTWTIKSSIIAANAGGFGDVSGAYTSGGFNLIGNPGTSTGFVNGTKNDQVGTSAAPLDPKLDPLGLKDNGGTTPTIALLAGSPAIDKGSSDALAGKLDNDQRQVFARTYDDAAVTNAADGCDIGAFELQPGGPTPSPTPTPTPSPSPTPTPSPSPTPTPSPSPSPSPSPTPSPTPQVPSLQVTVTSLVRSNCGSIAVGMVVQNVGAGTANNVRLTTGTLASPTTNGTPLPNTLGNLAPGQWAIHVVTFAGTNNAPGQKKTLTIGGTYNGGTFTNKWKVTLP